MTQIYSAVNSLFTKTRKKREKTSVTIGSTKNRKRRHIHTKWFEHYMGGIDPLRTLTPPPPPPSASQTPCFYLAHSH